MVGGVMVVGAMKVGGARGRRRVAEDRLDGGGREGVHRRHARTQPGRVRLRHRARTVLAVAESVLLPLSLGYSLVGGEMCVAQDLLPCVGGPPLPHL